MDLMIDLRNIRDCSEDGTRVTREKLARCMYVVLLDEIYHI